MGWWRRIVVPFETGEKFFQNNVWPGRVVETCGLVWSDRSMDWAVGMELGFVGADHRENPVSFGAATRCSRPLSVTRTPRGLSLCTLHAYRCSPRRRLRPVHAGSFPFCYSESPMLPPCCRARILGFCRLPTKMMVGGCPYCRARWASRFLQPKAGMMAGNGL